MAESLDQPTPVRSESELRRRRARGLAARPRSRGPRRRAGAPAVRARLLEPHLPRALRRARARRAPGAARREHQERPRHGARVPHPLRARPGVAQGAAAARALRRRVRHRHAVLRHGARARDHPARAAARGARRSTPPRCARVSEATCDTLAEIHNLDWKAVGLGDLGKPEGYVERQVRGWAERYAKARTDDVPHGRPARRVARGAPPARERRDARPQRLQVRQRRPRAGPLARRSRCSTGRWPRSATR